MCCGIHVSYLRQSIVFEKRSKAVACGYECVVEILNIETHAKSEMHICLLDLSIY